MIPGPEFHERELTGAARVRMGWFGRMVLQVEYRETAFSACPPPGRNNDAAWREFCRRGATTGWRDATWLDLQALPAFTLGSYATYQPPRSPPPATPPDARACGGAA